MTDAEKREKVIRGLECCTKDECECCPYEDVCFGDDEVELFDTLARDALALLKAEEAVDAAPVVHGRWQGVSPFVDTEECSNCRYNIQSEELRTPYCPWCGAKMDGERRDDDALSGR